MRGNQDRTATAYHEAGHAVVAWFCDHFIGLATIKPDAEQGVAGRISHHDQNCNALFDPFELVPHPEASGEWVVMTGETTARHLTDAEKRILEIQDGLDEISLAGKVLMIAAAGVVAQGKAIPDSVEPYHGEGDWESAAEELQIQCDDLGISETQARAHATERCRELLEDSIVWKAVDAVTNALLKEETMQGDEVQAVIRLALRHHHAE